VDRGGTRNQVKKGGGGLRIEDRGLDRFHDDKGDIVEGVPFNSLYKGGAEGRVDLVSEGDAGGGKRCTVAFDQYSSFSKGGVLSVLL
jgi:hypothetical protein